MCNIVLFCSVPVYFTSVQTSIAINPFVEGFAPQGHMILT